MTCNEFNKLIAETRPTEMTKEKRRTAAEHMASCPYCSELMAALAAGTVMTPERKKAEKEMTRLAEEDEKTL